MQLRIRVEIKSSEKTLKMQAKARSVYYRVQCSMFEKLGYFFSLFWFLAAGWKNICIMQLNDPSPCLAGLLPIANVKITRRGSQSDSILNTTLISQYSILL